MNYLNLIIFSKRRQSKKYIMFILFYFILFSVTLAQPKITFHLGGGFYSPSLGYLDADSNSVIPKRTSLGQNILLDWGVKYQFYPNTRIGYSRSNSYHLGKLGDSDYLRTISYRMITFETFYYPRERMELNFMLAPMYNKGTIKLSSKASSLDWDSILSSFGNSEASLSTEGEMTKRWLGLASMIGFRYYINHWFAVDGKAGFIQNSYSEKKWKLEGKKVEGPTMNIKKLPVFKVHFIFGW